jgi:hypothetical protein
MFCPQCGTGQSEEVNFCKLCGANLLAVRQAVASRAPDEKFDWSKTWVAEMFLSEEERQRRAHELERQRGITPEMKRYSEIKAGVITSCAGLGVSIFLYFFIQGIILSGQNSPGDNEILSRVWFAGLIPILVGLGIIFNGTFLGKRQIEAARRDSRPEHAPAALGASQPAALNRSLNPADTTEFVTPDFSVTEDPTKHFQGSPRKQ